ncbi:c-type cytochrome [bacterium]|nr:c-type cytochrome [bacterium]
MNSFELNKIAAAILLSGLIAMIVGTVTGALYDPHHDATKRGFKVEVAEEETGAAVAAEPAKPEVLDVKALMAAADAKRGEAVVKKCAACHDFTKGGPNRVGPNLYGIVGNKKAHAADFAYSKAMQEKGGTWTEEDLLHFLKKPKDFVPGTKMSFAGIAKPEERADLVAYLSTLK